MTPLINMLIRHKEGREMSFYQCINSIRIQSYNNINLIIAREYINSSLLLPLLITRWINVPAQHYNLHCNDLKAQVKEGWFFFLDDDDYLASPTVLEELSYHLFEGALIVQFLRKNNNGRGRDVKKPSDRMMYDKIIKKGMIGGGCLVLHHSFKDVADWRPYQGADYDWIKAVTDVVPTRFVPLVLQIAETKNNGR
jgi:hypothetical protein